MCLYGISAAFLKTNTIRVNRTDVNKHDPKIHAQLYVTGGKEGERRTKHFN